MRLWGLTALLTAFLVLLPQFAAADVPEGVTRYRARDRPTNRARIAAGVEDAISSLSFIIRPFARRKLKVDRFDIETLEFRISAKAVGISHDDHVTRSGRTGERVLEKDGKDSVWISQRVLQDSIVQVFEMENGELELQYTFSADASVVTVHAVLRSPKLPKPLRYHLTFDRSR